MPGIAGIIRRGWSDHDAAALNQMLTCMARENGDPCGTWVNESMGLGLVWVCHPGSFDDCLPIWNEAKDICLVFSGEHFSDRKDLESLATQGHRFNPDHADSLVHLYEDVGIEFLGRLNGWFSGVLVDLRESKAVLFNDRYGLKRICFHDAADGFYFASEAKALLAVLPQLRQLDPRGLGEFFSCGCVLQNRTLFPGLSLLPGGARWTFLPDGTCRKESYFTPERWENQPPLAAAEYSARLAEAFQRVLPPYVNGTQAVGMSLTGGIDSRMILAWAKPRPGTLPCYTFGGPYRDSMDVRLARRLAKACGLSHQTIRIGEDFLREFPALAEKTVYLSDGAMDVSGAAELYANRCAREIAPIRLTGNYGSEILRSIVAFRPGRLDESLFDRDFIPQLRTAETTYEKESQGRRLSFIAFKQVPWHHFARSAIEQSQLTVRSPFLDNDLVSLAYRAPPELVTDTRHLLHIIAKGNPALARIGTDRAFHQRSIPIVSWLSHSFQEFTAKAEYVYDYGMPQWLAKVDHAFSPLHLERLFLGRHKFCHFRVWYRDSLAEFVRAVLLDPSALARPHLDGRRVEQVVIAHLCGQGNYTQELHKLLTCELTHRLLIERN